VSQLPASANTDHDTCGDETNNDKLTKKPVSVSAEQARQVIRLIQCPICSCPLQEPYTLPCGRTLCRACLPPAHQRSNISYPATANRLQGFNCPFSVCTKAHAVGDCNLDVSLNKALGAAKTELIKEREAAVQTNTGTHITVKDEWEEAGIPSLKETTTLSRQLSGGRLVATFSLAQGGELRHDAEVSYTSCVDDGQTASDNTVLERIKEAVRPEMECQVCYALFYEPITTPCGHTFCRSCLQRVLDHSRCCPVCRCTLTIEPMMYRDASPTNQLIDKIITAFWSDLLEDRRQMVMTESRENGNGGYDVAVFVCTLSFPTMPTFLHVFEPRYRLMIRRALAGNRTFGMVPYQGDGFKELGTLLRIVNVEFFPDGRCLLESVGISRFRILEHGMLDGYIVANIQRITDISLAEEEELEVTETTQPQIQIPPRSRTGRGLPTFGAVPSRDKTLSNRSELDNTPTNELMAFAVDFVRRMQDQSVGWLTARIIAINGECPEDPALFPWWFANILPVNDREKYRLLSTTSVRERLKICCAWILEWERNVW